MSTQHVKNYCRLSLPGCRSARSGTRQEFRQPLDRKTGPVPLRLKTCDPIDSRLIRETAPHRSPRGAAGDSLRNSGKSGYNTSRRGGFSLLEVMLATAMLAASAMVLSSLLGLGAKYGSRAEARTEALSQAQSLLAEFLAMPGEEDELESERTGLLNSTPPRSFRIRVVEASPTGGDPVETASSAPSMVPTAMSSDSGSSDSGYGDGSTTGSDSARAPQPSRLVLVTVEVFETADADSETTQAPLTQLSQLVRVPAVETP